MIMYRFGKNRIVFYICKKNSWQCSTRPINVLYLLARLASKNGKTDIGDTLVNKSSSRMVAYPHFLLILPFEP